MTISQSLQDDVCQKLRMVGLPREIVLPLVNQLTRQVRAEGPENVVKRLKNLKQAAVNRIAGLPVDFPWIANNGTSPKGPWKPVWAMLSGDYRKQKRALNAMMVYASLVLPKGAGPTPTQEAKFVNSVHVDEVDRAARVARLNEAVSRGAFRKGRQALLSALRGKVDMTSLPDHPDLWVFLGRHYGLDASSVRRLETHLSKFLGSDFGRSFHAFPSVQRFLGEVGEDYFSMTAPWNGAKWDWRTTPPPDDPVGVIGSAQEPGFKFRAFAAPSPVLQGALQPLKEKLLTALHQLPWDCTHNQEKGVQSVQSWLNEGKTVYSVDLSDATNNFPLALQLQVLKDLLVPEEAIRLLELVSRSPYRVSWKKDGSTLSWNVGQPLGSGPSFMAFALAHAVVALDAEIAAGVAPQYLGTTFRLLGDDFVTCDPKVHEEYRRRLKWLSVPISEPKCLQSDVAGEFAGKVITRHQVFHGYKFREVSDLSFLSVIRTLGRQALSRKLLSEDQYRYAKLVESLPEPFGLGFNPQGRPLKDRYEEYLVLSEALEALRKPQSKATIAELRNKVVYHLSHSHYRYYPALTDRNDPEKVKERGYLVHATSLFERIRGAALTSTQASKGDPRPNPLQDWRRRYSKDVSPIVTAVRESQNPVRDETQQDATRLAPSVLPEGETSPEREAPRLTLLGETSAPELTTQERESSAFWRSPRPRG
nr:MAG: RNA-dependent RNA polymerases [Mitoviridae sp.]